VKNAQAHKVCNQHRLKRRTTLQTVRHAHPVQDELSKVCTQALAAVSQQFTQRLAQLVALQLGSPCQAQAQHWHCQHLIALSYHIHLQCDMSIFIEVLQVTCKVMTGCLTLFW